MRPAEVFAKRNLSESPSRISKVKFVAYDGIAVLRDPHDTKERFDPERTPGNFAQTAQHRTLTSTAEITVTASGTMSSAGRTPSTHHPSDPSRPSRRRCSSLSSPLHNQRKASCSCDESSLRAAST